MWLLTLRDLQYRRLRVIVVVLLASVVMALLFLMTGLVNQFNREPFATAKAIGAEHWVLAEGTSGPFTSNGTVSADLLRALGADAEGVVVGRGTAAAAGTSEASDVMVVGVDADYHAGELSPALVEGRVVAAPSEVVLDESAGFDVGDEVQVGPLRVTVVGLTGDTTVLAGLPLLFVELGAAQDAYFDDRSILSGVLLDEAPPAAPAGTVIRDVEFVGEDALEPLKDAIGSVDLVRALLWLVTGVIIGAVVFLSALERQRDFAILRAMGTPKRALLLGMAAQAVLIALLAALVAIVLQRLIVPVFPLEVNVPGRALWQIPLIAAVISLVAGAAGLRKVARADPASAFSGQGA